MMVTSILTKTEWPQTSIRKQEKIGVRAKWGLYDRSSGNQDYMYMEISCWLLTRVTFVKSGLVVEDQIVLKAIFHFIKHNFR